MKKHIVALTTIGILTAPFVAVGVSLALPSAIPAVGLVLINEYINK